MATTLFSISFVIAKELMRLPFHTQDEVLSLLPDPSNKGLVANDGIHAVIHGDPAPPIQQMMVGSRRGFIPSQIELLAQAYSVEGVEFLCRDWTSINLEDDGYVQVLQGDAVRRALSSIENLLDSVRRDPQRAADALADTEANMRSAIESNLLSSEPTFDPAIGIPDHDGESWECMFATLRTARHLLCQAVQQDAAFVHLDF